MKIEDSGMPEEFYWNSLFDIKSIVDWLAIAKNSTIAEVGCGYGTFTVPVAQRTSGKVYAFDIDVEMLSVTQHNVQSAKLKNVELLHRDVLDAGTGLAAESVDLVLLFNILHFSERRIFLAEATRILRKGGVAVVLHWRKDIATPRGPAVELRPDQAQILLAASGLPLRFEGNSQLLPPYHWGMQLVKE
jgi:ubiquinone/menaquinone biosynthesis C-methylase UbiE